MDWIAFFRQHYSAAGDRDPLSRPRFHRPAASAELIELESSIGKRLPVELLEILGQSDGILDELLIGEEWIENIWLVWPVCELKRLVKLHRDAGVPPEYLAFSSAGADGILFLCPLGFEQGTNSPVFVWHPIEGTVELVVPSMASFYSGWIRGEVNS